MKRTVCPTCGHRTISDSRNDRWRIRRRFDICDHCGEQGWEMAVTSEEYQRGETRRQAQRFEMSEERNAVAP